MEKLIADIEAYCAKSQIAPEKLLKASVGATWGLWQKWKSGDASPTMKVADRIHAYMAANPPPPGVSPSSEDQDGVAA